MTHQQHASTSEPAGAAQRTWLWGAITAAAFMFVWFAWKLLFLAFGGFLLAVILNSIAHWVMERTHLGPKLSYLVTIVGIAGLIALVCWFLVPRAIQETGEIVKVIPKSLQDAKDFLQQKGWGRYVLEAVQRGMSGSGGGFNFSSIAKGGFEAIEDFVVIVVVGFFGALNPSGYTQGLLRLIPETKRERAREMSSEVVYVVRWWLLGQLIPMSVLGLAAMISLWFLGVPLAFTLGLFTGVMIFIPYIGALLSEIPAVLVALAQGEKTALYVLILYLGIHALEGYILTPLVQKRAVQLPPVFTILFQLFMWMIGGLLGVVIATPLAAAVLVLVKMLYLHEKIEH